MTTQIEISINLNWARFLLGSALLTNQMMEESMLIKIAGVMKLRVTAKIRILNGFVKLEKVSKKD